MPLRVFKAIVFFSGFVVVTYGVNVEDFNPIYPSVVSVNDTRIALTLGLMVSFSGAYVTSSSIAGVQIALDLINENSSLLPGYRLQYKLTDSQCDQTVALNNFFQKYMWRPPTILGLVGSGCEDATIAVAAISHYFNITQVSSDSAAPELENRTIYTRYFQMIPNEASLPIVFKTLFLTYGWHKLHTIAANNDVFVTVLHGTRALLSDIANITYVIYNNAEPLSSIDFYIRNGNLFDQDARIIELAMYESDARKVVCEAYHQMKMSPKYIFILRSWYPYGWWDPANELDYVLNCTKSEMEKALNGSLTVALDADYDFDVSLSGLTYQQYDDMYMQRAINLGLDYKHRDPTFFDAMWTYAVALNSTITDLKSNSSLNMAASIASRISTPFSIENVTYSNNIIAERMFKHLSNTNFTGISGDVSFNDNGIRSSFIIYVQQYRLNDDGNLRVVDVGYVTQDGELIYYENESIQTIFPYGIPPDGTIHVMEVEIEVSLTIVMYILALFGMILAAACLVFIAVCRETRLVRLTSPALTVITCCGCLLLYICILFVAIQSNSILATSVLCNVRIWLWAIGYSLAFGPILAKTYRIYYIFNNPRPNKLAVKDWMLALVVCALVSIDVVFMIITLLVPQLRVNAVLEPHKENLITESGFFQEKTMNMILVCESTPKKTFQTWRIILVTYKALVQVSAIPLAFSVRKVKMRGLNDSKYIVSIVYITSISLAVIIVCFAAIYDSVNASAAVYSFGAWITATIILSLLFIPKVYYLYCDPNGENLATISNTDEKLSSMEDRIRQLETELSTLKRRRKTIKEASQAKCAMTGNCSSIGGIEEHVQVTESNKVISFAHEIKKSDMYSPNAGMDVIETDDCTTSRLDLIHPTMVTENNQIQYSPTGEDVNTCANSNIETYNS